MDPVCASLWNKLAEQLDHTGRLLELLPPDSAAWRPPVAGSGRPLMSTQRLTAHLVECVAGFLAVLLRLRPTEMAHVERYRALPAPVTVAGVRERIALYRTELEAVFPLLTAADLAATVPTVFVAAGEPAMTLLLGNLEHLINHKQQLFLYLRLQGVAVGTGDLYRLRGA